VIKLGEKKNAFVFDRVKILHGRTQMLMRDLFALANPLVTYQIC